MILAFNKRVSYLLQFFKIHLSIVIIVAYLWHRLNQDSLLSSIVVIAE